jgi:hypothetical protein
LEWDPTESISSQLRLPGEDLLRDGTENLSQAASSQKDDIVEFFVMDKANAPKTRFGWWQRKTKEFRYLMLLAFVVMIAVIAVVTAFVISSKIKTSNKNTVVLPPIGACDFSSSTKDIQVDPWLQCECTQKVDLILDSVVLTHEAIYIATNITGSEFDIHSCSPGNMALLWAAKDVALNNYSLETGVTRFALAYMYWTWRGDGWKTKDNWVDSETPVCIWYGVHCDEDDNIVAIGLSGNNLNGVVTNHIGLIKSLKILDLSLNRLRGTIDHDWWKLSNLGMLTTVNDLDFFNTLTSLSHKAILVSLNLNYNDLSGNFPELVSPEGESLLPFLGKNLS